jgi:hypothetical protein
MKKKASSDTKATNTSDPPQPTKRRLAYVGMKDRRVQEEKNRTENAELEKFLVVSSSEAFSIEFGAPAASELQRGVGLKQMEITKGAKKKMKSVTAKPADNEALEGVHVAVLRSDNSVLWLAANTNKTIQEITKYKSLKDNSVSIKNLIVDNSGAVLVCVWINSKKAVDEATADIWNLHQNSLQSTLECFPRTFDSVVAINTGGTRVAILSPTEGLAIFVWNTRTGSLLFCLEPTGGNCSKHICFATERSIELLLVGWKCQQERCDCVAVYSASTGAQGTSVALPDNSLITPTSLDGTLFAA